MQLEQAYIRHITYRMTPKALCEFFFFNKKLIGTFLLSPHPHQKIRKTVEIVPEKMKKSSIEILQILVLSKYN